MRILKLEFALAFLIIIGLLSITGCKPGTTLVPVEGTVMLNNQPLVDATVLFSPTRANGPGPFVGTTNSQGQFVLGPVGKPGGGAAADAYLVMITTVKPDPDVREGDSPSTTQKEVVPQAYRDGSQRFTVPDGGTTKANFDVKSR